MKELNFDQATPAAPVAGPPDKDARAVARKAKDAARKRIERAIAKPSPVSDFWLKNEREFALADPERWQALAERAADVDATSWELQVAMFAFDRGDPIQAAIMSSILPDQIYREIKLDVERYGQLSYCSIEASKGDSECYVDFRSSKSTGDPESAYRNFGMRLCLDSDTLADARGFAICWWLTSTVLDEINPIIEEAISSLGWGISHYSQQARKLINRRNGILERSTLCTEVPISESIAKPQTEIDRIIALKKSSAEQYDRWIREARRGEN